MTNAEYRRRRRSVRVPEFFRKKVLMIFAMLLCSGILVGLATYAWFTLSSNPEVRGITATVGANGSLEIALLNNETGQNTSLIEADVGDAISIVGAVESNITWGNLVDLGDATYGLNTVVLYPAELNRTDGILDTQAMLKIPRTGPDGRVDRISPNTVASVYNGAAFTTQNAHYGVRAIGALSSGNDREGYLTAAKRGFETSRSSAQAAAMSAVTNHNSILMGIAISQMAGLTVTYSYNQLGEIQVMMAELRNSLNYILTCYKQAIIATAAANDQISNSDFEGIRLGVSQAKGNELASYAANFPAGVSAADLSALQSSIDTANTAIDLCNRLFYKDYGTENETPVPTTTRFSSRQVEPITNTIVNPKTLPSLDEIQKTKEIVLTATQGEGLLTDIADYIGNYSTQAEQVTAHVTTDKQDGKGLLSTIHLDALTVPAAPPGEDTNNSTVSEFYGYVMDLAFRSNASTDLLLQSEAADRVYTDGVGATAGSGSKVTYTFAAGMSETQVKALLSAVRVVFFDPESGSIYGTARLDTPTIVGITAKACLYMCRESGALLPDRTAITHLDPIVPKKVSVLVYLNGEDIDNGSVINAENSGSMALNLQFASSVKLNPMIDDDLKNASAGGN